MIASQGFIQSARGYTDDTYTLNIKRKDRSLSDSAILLTEGLHNLKIGQRSFVLLFIRPEKGGTKKGVLSPRLPNDVLKIEVKLFS